MTITAKMVKELRDITGVGMMDAKKALTETNGDFESASDWLRQKGLAKAQKKSGRIAAEGLIGIKLSSDSAILIEANCENIMWGTDWPHPNKYEVNPNDGDLVDAFGEWVTDDAMRKKIMVTNPEKFYAF